MSKEITNKEEAENLPHIEESELSSRAVAMLQQSMSMIRTETQSGLPDMLAAINEMSDEKFKTLMNNKNETALKEQDTYLEIAKIQSEVSKRKENIKAILLGLFIIGFFATTIYMVSKDFKDFNQWILHALTVVSVGFGGWGIAQTKINKKDKKNKM